MDLVSSGEDSPSFSPTSLLFFGVVIGKDGPREEGGALASGSKTDRDDDAVDDEDEDNRCTRSSRSVLETEEALSPGPSLPVTTPKMAGEKED